MRVLGRGRTVKLQSYKRVLLTWEMGGGFGHVLPLKRLASQYMNMGCHVTVALPDLHYRSLFLGNNINVIKAPVVRSINKPAVDRVKSMAEILYYSGWSSYLTVGKVVKQWRKIFFQEKPDLLIADFSPAALLASRDLIRSVSVGNSFCIPDRKPILSFPYTYLEDRDRKVIEACERKVLSNVNRIRRNYSIKKELNQCGDLFYGDDTKITVHRDLDIYQRKSASVSYYNEKSVRPENEADTFYKTGKPKVLAYIKDIAKWKNKIDKFIDSNSCEFVAFTGGNNVNGSFSKARFKIVNKSIDMPGLIGQVDTVICNGGSNVINETYLANKKLLIWPESMEQSINKRHIQSIYKSK